MLDGVELALTGQAGILYGEPRAVITSIDVSDKQDMGIARGVYAYGLLRCLGMDKTPLPLLAGEADRWANRRLW